MMLSILRDLFHNIINLLSLKPQPADISPPTLPQELIDEIIRYLSLFDRQSLGNCSLVAKSWIHTSQKYLFESVTASSGNLRPRLDGISRMKLSGLIFHLTCDIEDLCRVWPIELAAHDSDHSHSLQQLSHLNLPQIILLSFPQDIELPFKPTLSQVTLSYCRISMSSLVALVEYFPKLESLCLKDVDCLDPHEKSILSPLHPLKNLSISEGGGVLMTVPDEFSQLGFRFDEITLDPASRPFVSAAFVNRVARAFGACVKFLRLPQTTSGMCDPPYSNYGDLWS